MKITSSSTNIVIRCRATVLLVHSNIANGSETPRKYTEQVYSVQFLNEPEPRGNFRQVQINQRLRIQNEW